MPVSIPDLHIVLYPHPILRKKANPVPEVNDEVREVANRMIELMHEAEGVGLAAPQIGLPWRLFVTNSRLEDDGDRVYVNPILTNPGGDWDIAEEGCLSLPDINGDVRRPSAITIEATTLDGESFTMTADGFLARIWQHEFDHLNGTLIFDRFTQLSKLSNRKLIKALEKKNAK